MSFNLDFKSKNSNLDALMLQTANIANVSQFLNLFQAKTSDLDESFFASRRKIFYFLLAVCKLDLKMINLDNKLKCYKTDIYFPKCIRVLRCGGCCDINDRMTCVAVKTSLRDV